MKSIFRLFSILKKLFKTYDKVENLLLLQAKSLHQQHLLQKETILSNIQKSEFKVFSQFGDDGIIQFLIDYLEIKNKTFIEFGVENYLEANTRYLLIENNWKGLIMDGSKKNIDYVKSDNIYWKHDLTAVHAFVTKENINSLIESHGFMGEIGLLHIDIDGNDYWIWDSIHVVDPIILILEYNSLFGASNHWTIPYQDDFYRTNAHFSNIYYGASLAALVSLSDKKGYIFIGSNSAGNNAFFVKKEFAKDLNPITSEEGYINSKFRESRDVNGQLTYLNKENQLKLIKGMPIVNTQTLKLEKIS